jgi:hypothetical protein
MVWMFQFFFSYIKSIHLKYKEFFGTNEQDEQPVDEDVEVSPKISPSEATARFYFELTYKLSNDDITKFKQIDESGLYLCLNTASLIKDRITKEQNELKKLKNEMKINR